MSGEVTTFPLFHSKKKPLLSGSGCILRLLCAQSAESFDGPPCWGNALPSVLNALTKPGKPPHEHVAGFNEVVNTHAKLPDKIVGG